MASEKMHNWNDERKGRDGGEAQLPFAGVPASGQPQQGPRGASKGVRTFVATALLLWVGLCVTVSLGIDGKLGHGPGKWLSLERAHMALMRHAVPLETLAAARCPQQDAYAEEVEGINLPDQTTMAHRLSEAVSINTAISDNWPSPKDDPQRWEPIFKPFREWMHKAFPKVHDDNGPVKLELVNQNGLVYTWKGQNEGLKPILLMAHQDVVPVNALVEKDWIHPPFSGFFDEGNQTVWGRGSFDAKAWLVSIMATLEAMLESGHAPQRTIVVAFGFDEEASGPHGAGTIGPMLHERYGDDSFAMVVDEGTPVLGPHDGANRLQLPLAMVAVAEKGSMHVSIKVQANGGHSSFPAEHTSVSMLARLVTALEEWRVFGEAIVTGTDDDAPYRQMQCLADAKSFPSEIKAMMADLDWALAHPRGRGRKHHAKGAHARKHGHCHGKHKRSLSQRLAGRLAQLLDSDHRRSQRIALARKRLSAALHKYPDLKNPAETTRAVDIFNGGVKVNALPEEAEAIVDHRISVLSSVADVKAAYQRVFEKEAGRLGLDADIFGKKFSARAGRGGWACEPDCAAVLSEPTRECPIRCHGRDGSAAGKEPAGTLTVRMWDENELEPAPNTPTTGDAAAPWRLVSSVVRKVWQQQAEEVMRGSSSAAAAAADGIRVVPALMQGNTDTRRYWALSKHIFRFGPATLLPDTTGLGGWTQGVHTTNERYHADGLVKAVNFYALLLQALDKEEGM